MAEKEPDLTDKQKAFCHEYIIDFNGSAAAIRAGYSADSSRSIASELLTKPDIQAYKDLLLDKQLEGRKKEIRNRVVTNLEQIGWNDLERDENYNRDGELVSVSRKDRLKALELLGKTTGLFNDKIEITGKNGESPIFNVVFVEPENKEDKPNDGK